MFQMRHGSLEISLGASTAYRDWGKGMGSDEHTYAFMQIDALVHWLRGMGVSMFVWSIPKVT